MAQLNLVRRAFVFSLNNMLHGRVAYPGKDAEGTPSPGNSPSDSALPEELRDGD